MNGQKMGEGLVTGERASLESAQTRRPADEQHGNSAKWVEEGKRVYGE
jgi:hypothetical protein